MDQAIARAVQPDTGAAIVDHALRVMVEIRIAELVQWRSWYRRQPRWDYWMDLARDNDVRLRELLRLTRTARRAARGAIERQDPLTQAAAYADWAPGELTEAFGR